MVSKALSEEASIVRKGLESQQLVGISRYPFTNYA